MHGRNPQSTRESQVQAVTYVEYPAGEVPPTVNDPTELSPRDFLIDTDTTLPQRGQLFLYGFRRTQGILGEIMHQARQRDHLIRILEFPIAVGQYRPQKQTLDGMADFRFLNIPDRAKAEVLNDMQEKWATLLAKEGLPQDGFPRKPSKHMHLLDSLLEMPPYNQLSGVAFPVHTEAGWVKALLASK